MNNFGGKGYLRECKILGTNAFLHPESFSHVFMTLRTLARSRNQVEHLFKAYGLLGISKRSEEELIKETF